jgi:hypothetical protein
MKMPEQTPLELAREIDGKPTKKDLPEWTSYRKFHHSDAKDEAEFYANARADIPELVKRIEDLEAGTQPDCSTAEEVAAPMPPLDLNEIRKKNRKHSSRAVRPEEIEELVKRIEELEGLNAELVKNSRQDWLKSPAFQTFIDLKHGPIGTILMLLQEGQISRGKCAEALAELAHGIAPEDVRLPAFSESVFTDDQTPAEVCAAKDAEITRLTAERDNLRSVCAEAYQLAGAVGAPARVLNRLIAAAQGTDIGESFLPVSPDECRRNQTLNWPRIKSRLVDGLFSLMRDIEIISAERVSKEAEIESLRKTLEAVREKVEAAPHYEECQSDYYTSSGGLPDPCDCWKAPALALIGAALKPKAEEQS